MRSSSSRSTNSSPSLDARAGSFAKAPSYDSHTKRLRDLGKLCANSSQTDEANCLAPQLHTELVVPDPLPNSVIGKRDRPCHVQQQPHIQLGHRDRGRGGCVRDNYSQLSRRRQIYLVRPCPEDRDQSEPGQPFQKGSVERIESLDVDHNIRTRQPAGQLVPIGRHRFVMDEVTQALQAFYLGMTTIKGREIVGDY